MILDDELKERLAADGFVVLPRVLSPEQLERARAALAHSVEVAEAAGEPTFDRKIDYNARNIRVYRLQEKDPFFAELLEWPESKALCSHLLGEDAIMAEFSANNALPGSLPMKLHSDQALVLQPPWDQPMALNVIWVLDDLSGENGATRYLPGSHKFRSFDDLPDDPDSLMVPFEAPAGSIVAMEGRLWHTSGANVTKDRQRRLAFAYFMHRDIQPNVDWLAKFGVKEDGKADAV